jgi:hypothetical protein
LSTCAIDATGLALILTRSIASITRIVTAFAEFLRIPILVLNIVSELWTLSLVAAMLEEFIPCHAFEALCRTLRAALRAPYSRTTSGLHVKSLRLIIVSYIDTTLAIDWII